MKTLLLIMSVLSVVSCQTGLVTNTVSSNPVYIMCPGDENYQQLSISTTNRGDTLVDAEFSWMCGDQLAMSGLYLKDKDSLFYPMVSKHNKELQSFSKASNIKGDRHLCALVSFSLLQTRYSCPVFESFKDSVNRCLLLGSLIEQENGSNVRPTALWANGIGDCDQDVLVKIKKLIEASKTAE